MYFLPFLKACLAALLYLAGVKIALEAGLGSLGNGAFSHGPDFPRPLVWRVQILVSRALTRCPWFLCSF